MSAFPFDLVVYLDNVPPWHDCNTCLDAFQAQVEVASADPDDWSVYGVQYQRLSDGAFVFPASGSEQERLFLSAANSREGERQIANQVRDAISRLPSEAELAAWTAADRAHDLSREAA